MKKDIIQKIDEITLNERPHLMKIYGKEIEILDNVLDSLKNIKDIKDPLLRKKIVSIRIQLKQLQGELLKL